MMHVHLSETAAAGQGCTRHFVSYIPPTLVRSMRLYVLIHTYLSLVPPNSLPELPSHSRSLWSIFALLESSTSRLKVRLLYV